MEEATDTYQRTQESSRGLQGHYVVSKEQKPDCKTKGAGKAMTSKVSLSPEKEFPHEDFLQKKKFTLYAK